MSKFTYTQNNGTTMSVAVFLKRHLDIRSKSGLEWQALCPFHQDTSPSFSVNIRKGLYICYACGAKGNLKSLAKHFDDNEPIAQSASLDEVMDKIKELSETINGAERPSVGVPYGSRYTDNEFVLRYWKDKRDLSEETIKTYELGFDPLDNTAIIPVKDMSRRTIGLIRRTTDPQELAAGYPKYKHPKGIKMSHYLFGAVEAKDNFTHKKYGVGTRRSVLMVCEGPIDAMFCRTEFLVGKNVLLSLAVSGVAVFGARMSHEQARIIETIAPDYIVIATDQDRAGRLAALQIESELRSMKLGSFIYQMTWDKSLGKDIAELPETTRCDLILSTLGFHNRVGNYFQQFEVLRDVGAGNKPPAPHTPRR